MAKQGFQIYLIIASAMFSFIAGTFKLWPTYSVITAFFLFLFNIAMGYVIFLSWKYIEAKLLTTDNLKHRDTFSLLIFTLFILAGSAVFDALYAGLFVLLFGYEISLLRIIVFASAFYLFISSFILYFSLLNKLAIIREKENSLDFISQ